MTRSLTKFYFIDVFLYYRNVSTSDFFLLNLIEAMMTFLNELKTNGFEIEFHKVCLNSYFFGKKTTKTPNIKLNLEIK